jgi:hypothetical protein
MGVKTLLKVGKEPVFLVFLKRYAVAQVLVAMGLVVRDVLGAFCPDGSTLFQYRVKEAWQV